LQSHKHQLLICMANTRSHAPTPIPDRQQFRQSQISRGNRWIHRPRKHNRIPCWMTLSPRLADVCCQHPTLLGVSSRELAGSDYKGLPKLGLLRQVTIPMRCMH
jgi:hypothetical protein